MSDARVLHKKAGCGDRACTLTDFEYRVWTQYILSADDYGVMRASESVIRAGNRRLENERAAKVQRALERILAVELVNLFVNQKVRYFWQADWQDFQGIRHPRFTVNPAPDTHDLLRATPATLDLFYKNPAVKAREDFGNPPEIVPTLAGAGAGETLTLPLTPLSPLPPDREESARETRLAPAWRAATDAARGAGSAHGIVNGADLRRHAGHIAGCERDKCVDQGMHAGMCRALGTEDADSQLRAWYPAVLRRYQGVAIGDDRFQFWRNEFAAWVGTVTKAPAAGAQTKGIQTVAAAQRAVLARQAARDREAE